MSRRDCLVGIVDYQAGNIHSIRSAFEHLGVRTADISTPEDLAPASHILLPGVGAFGHCAEKLHATGLVPALKAQVVGGGKPLLGICVGMQLLADRGEEMGAHSGLGWVGGVVRAMTAHPPEVRIPHVGWNDVTFNEEFGAFKQGDSADFYFDHSYAYRDPPAGRAIGHCDHGGRFVAIVRDRNIVAAQFHPEKSQAAGLRFLAGFLAMEAAC